MNEKYAEVTERKIEIRNETMDDFKEGVPGDTLTVYASIKAGYWMSDSEWGIYAYTYTPVKNGEPVCEVIGAGSTEHITNIDAFIDALVKQSERSLQTGTRLISTVAGSEETEGTPGRPILGYMQVDEFRRELKDALKDGISALVVD